MPPPYTAHAECRIVGELHGQETINVLHFATHTVVNDPGSLDALLLQLAQALHDCVVQFLLPAVTSNWRFVQTDARRISPTPSDPVLSTGLPENVGELSEVSHSVSATLVNVRTGSGGKSGRGRMFLPPPGDGSITASTIDGPALVLIAAFTGCVATKFMGANKTTDWILGVLSRKQATAVGGTFDNAFREATSLNIAADLAVMTSRRKGNGR